MVQTVKTITAGSSFDSQHEINFMHDLDDIGDIQVFQIISTNIHSVWNQQKANYILIEYDIQLLKLLEVEPCILEIL